MQARHRLVHRFAGLVSDAPIFVAASLLTPGDSPRLPATRVEGWLAVHQPERSFS
jgi:hypothetical protein